MLLGQQLALETIDPPGVGLPFDAAITPDGREIWVLNAASNDITVVNTDTGQRVAHMEVATIHAASCSRQTAQKAYVNNTLAGTVSVVDTTNYTVTSEIPITDLPLPPLLLQGKRLFYSSDDPRMARDQWISCNTCHFEGEHDGRTWVFGFSGPRNTTSLLGMIETYPLRWSGEWDESADSEFANRRENFGAGLIEGDMHCDLSPPDCANQPPNQGRSQDLDALAAFIDSLRIPLSVTHSHGEPLSLAEARGQAIFERAELAMRRVPSRAPIHGLAETRCGYSHRRRTHRSRLRHSGRCAVCRLGPVLPRWQCGDAVQFTDEAYSGQRARCQHGSEPS